MSSIAAVLAKSPALAAVMRVAFRQVQPKYSAGVVGVIFNDFGEILIVEHVFHPGWNWGLPGGWLGKRERPADGLRRELLEELGLRVNVLRPLRIDVGDYSKSHLDISFLCQADGEVSQISPELSGFRWAKPEGIPRLLSFHMASVKTAMAFPATDAELVWE